MRSTEFISWVAIITLATAFILALAQKWKIVEWLQVHAPNDFLNELFSCKFCFSFHVSVIISLILALVTNEWLLLFVPICSTVVTCRLW